MSQEDSKDAQPHLATQKEELPHGTLAVYELEEMMDKKLKISTPMEFVNETSYPELQVNVSQEGLNKDRFHLATQKEVPCKTLAIDELEEMMDKNLKISTQLISFPNSPSCSTQADISYNICLSHEKKKKERKTGAKKNSNKILPAPGQTRKPEILVKISLDKLRQYKSLGGSDKTHSHLAVKEKEFPSEISAVSELQKMMSKGLNLSPMERKALRKRPSSTKKAKSSKQGSSTPVKKRVQKPDRKDNPSEAFNTPIRKPSQADPKMGKKNWL